MTHDLFQIHIYAWRNSLTLLLIYVYRCITLDTCQKNKWHTTCFKFISMRDITHSHCCLYMCIDASHLIPANKTYLFHSCIWDMTHSHFDASHLNPANKTYLFHTSIWDMTHSHFDASPLNPPFLCNFYALDSTTAKNKWDPTRSYFRK